MVGKARKSFYSWLKKKKKIIGAGSGHERHDFVGAQRDECTIVFPNIFFLNKKNIMEPSLYEKVVIKMRWN